MIGDMYMWGCTIGIVGRASGENEVEKGDGGSEQKEQGRKRSGGASRWEGLVIEKVECG